MTRLSRLHINCGPWKSYLIARMIYAAKLSGAISQLLSVTFPFADFQGGVAVAS